MPTLYDVLGVARDASPRAIRRAYLARAKVVHPDRGGDTEAFLLLDRAYKTLRDPTLRRLYDDELCPPRSAAPHGTDLWDHLEVPLAVAIRGGAVRFRDGHVTVPAGTLTGDRILLRGLGAPGRPPGDLVLEVYVQSHPLWRLQDLDLHVELPITWLEAYRGGAVPLRTPWRVVQLALAPRTADGLVFEVVGDGVRRDDAQGSLYVTIRLQAPAAGDVALTGCLLRLQLRENPRASLESVFA